MEGASVFPIDLRRASSLAGISYDELVDGMRSENAMMMEGMLLSNDQDDGDVTCAERLDVYLLTSTKVTFYGVPFGLQKIGGKTVLEHALAQLLLAGRTRVVIAIPSTLPEIRSHIEQSFLFTRLQIIFLELVPKVLESIPEAVLAARHLFAEPFLVHGADRVFDQKLLGRFCTFPVHKQNACMLIESNMDIAARMPSNTIRVEYLAKTKVVVGQDIEKFNAVDVGLYIVPLNIFLALDAAMQQSSSLPMAVALAACYESLSCMETERSPWFSIDTEEQLLHVLEFNLVNDLTPSNFARSQPEASPPKQRKSIVLSVASRSSCVSTAKQSRQLSTSTVESFHGFVVNVAEASSDASTPLLPPSTSGRNSCAIPSDITVDKTDPNEYTLKISLPANAPSLTHVQQNAYLIQQTMPKESKFILAVPDEPIKVNPLRRLSQLPSDVYDIALEAKAKGNAIEMKLTVNTQVPAVGYLILMVALFSVSAQGAALQTLTGIPPLLKLFWRAFGSAVFFGVMALFSLYFNGCPGQMNLDKLFVCVVSYLTFNSTFFWALDHTSVGHAYIFSNCHSLLIVFGKCVIGEPVAWLESSGAVIGAIGGAITTMDTGSTSTNSHVIEPSVSGDIVALAGAVGGVFYLINAKILREKLGVWIFISCLFISSSIMLIPVLSFLQVDFELSTDSQRGLFGWIHHFGTEMIIVVICSGFGTLGFINAMRYFPPLVISVTMLLEPVVATIFSLFSGTADVPHFLTFLGGFSVTLGTFFVIWSSRRSSKTIDVTSAVLSKESTSPKGYGST